MNLSPDSPNFDSFLGLSSTRSRLVFLVFLFGGDFLAFSRILLWMWKLFSPCSNPSNLKQTKCPVLISELHDWKKEIKFTFLDPDFYYWLPPTVFYLPFFVDWEYLERFQTNLHHHSTKKELPKVQTSTRKIYENNKPQTTKNIVL